MITRRQKRIARVCQILEQAGFKKEAQAWKNLGKPPEEEDVFVGWYDESELAEEVEDDSANFDQIVEGITATLEEIKQNTIQKLRMFSDSEKRSKSFISMLSYLNGLKFSEGEFGEDLAGQLERWRVKAVDSLWRQSRMSDAKDQKSPRRRK